jgi:hypothetical protein
MNVTVLGNLEHISRQAGRSVRTFVSDVAQGFFEVSHSALALLGVATLLAIAFIATRPDLRDQGEAKLLALLQARQDAATAHLVPLEPDAIERATAVNPKELPKQQAAVAYWLAKKYRVAPEPLAALVAEAYDISGRTKIDPTLLLAVMAVESSFNPFAQSPVGAQGLMQVMTNVHDDKYEGFGGKLAAFDPVTNLRVGATVLQDCIGRNGGVELGLRCYVGATSDATEGGYAAKVMAEHARLRQVAGGKAVPVFDTSAPAVIPASTTTQRPTPNVAPAAKAAPAASPSAKVEDKLAAVL